MTSTSKSGPKVKSRCQPAPASEKIRLLEAQLTSVRHHVNVLTAELALTHEWMFMVLGAEIINTESPHYKRVHGSSEIERLKQNLKLVLDNDAPDSEDNERDSPIIPLPVENRNTSSSNKASSSASQKPSRPLENAQEREHERSARNCERRSHKKSKPRCKQVPEVPIAKSAGAQDVRVSSNVNVTELKKRKRQTPGLGPIKCCHCGSRFATKQSLRIHEKNHTGERPFKCRYCEKAFPQLSNQIAHERTHTGEKPYICRYCKKAFAHSNNQLAHERTHTGEKPFACEYCDLQYRSLCSLTTHMQTHTNERPYPCRQCSMEFRRIGALKKHELNHQPPRG